MRISATDLATNDAKTQEPYNPKELLERLYTRIKKCVNYATAVVKPVTKGKIVRIA